MCMHLYIHWTTLKFKLYSRVVYFLTLIIPSIVMSKMRTNWLTYEAHYEIPFTNVHVTNNKPLIKLQMCKMSNSVIEDYIYQ